MKLDRLFCLLCLACIVLAAGCGENVRLYGRVTYPDGTPLRKGTVYFQDENIIGWGDIAPDGTYRIGMNNVGDGILPGSYNVYVSGAVDIEKPPEPLKEGDPVGDSKKTDLIDTRFSAPETSGITCKVEKGMKPPFDIVVDYPPK